MDGRAPGVLIQFTDPPPAVEPTRIDVPVLVCVTERGPVHTPVRCASWPAFRHTFGGFNRNGLGAYSAKAFFDNGGGPAWVVRVAAPERVTHTSGPQPAERTRSVVASTAGLVPGAAATLRRGSVVRTYLVVAVEAATGTVTWDRPLHPDLGPGPGIEVATGAGSASAVLPDSAGVPGLRVSAASPGAWGEALRVVCSAGNRASTTARPGTPGSATATPVSGTVGFAAGDSCRVSQELAGAVTAGQAVVAAVDHARRVLRWAAPLPVALDPGRPFTIETRSFDLAVLEAGTVVETWPGLTSEPEHRRYAPGVLQDGSAYLRAEVLGDQPAPGGVRLAGGRDGTAALTVTDLTGDELADDRLGLAAARDLDEPGVVLVPDLVAAPTPAVLTVPPPVDPCDPCRRPAQPPEVLEAVISETGASFDSEQVIGAQQRIVESCERNTERVALLDPPYGSRTLPGLRAWAARFGSSHAITVVPWLTVVEPGNSAAVRAVPASGHLAGLIAACDTAAGPWLSAANRTLAWAHGLTFPLSEAEHAAANDAGLNLIRPVPGRGLVPLGARTLAGEALWRYAAVRRTMIWLRRTLRHHLAWVVFEPVTPGLAALLGSAIGTLLTGVWEAGGLAGDTPEEAFFVAVDASPAAAGELRIVVGVALARPAEFVTVRVSRTGNRLELSEAPSVVLAGGG